MSYIMDIFRIVTKKKMSTSCPHIIIMDKFRMVTKKRNEYIP